jgi:Flp pilus assembly protein TadB
MNAVRGDRSDGRRDKRYDKRIRSGDEPIHARSPVRLRLGLALFGLVTTAVAAVLFVVVGQAGVAIAFAVVAVLAAVDAVVAAVRIRQGPHFQPGPDVPPYRPVDRHPERREREPMSLRTRRRAYMVLMGVCVTLVLLAWVWIRLVSTTAAIAMSAVAAVIPPVAAIVANARGDQWSRR